MIEGIVVPDQEERAKEEIERVNRLLANKLSEAFPQVLFADVSTLSACWKLIPVM